jgi:hypothetical protein
MPQGIAGFFHPAAALAQVWTHFGWDVPGTSLWGSDNYICFTFRGAVCVTYTTHPCS